jgi:dihydrofolate reductase
LPEYDETLKTNDDNKWQRRNCMRKVMVSSFVSLDGVMEEPQHWNFQFWNDEHTAYATEILFASDALLLGRETYEPFASSWSTRSGEFADKINSMPKFVASTTLKEPLTWNATLIKGNVPQAVAKLKQQPGKDIMIYGSSTLVRSLLPSGVIDDLRLWVHPIVLGSGRRVFEEGSEAKLKLLEAKPLSSGVVILSYGPANNH